MTEIERVESEIADLKIQIDSFEDQVARLSARLRERRAYLANLQGKKRDE
jgi:septal ring factor EnvC (AmiA/AmiB activator)